MEETHHLGTRSGSRKLWSTSILVAVLLYLYGLILSFYIVCLSRAYLIFTVENKKVMQITLNFLSVCLVS